jgi:hypothetical protein
MASKTPMDMSRGVFVFSQRRSDEPRRYQKAETARDKQYKVQKKSISVVTP